jgi:phosphoribosylamine---glycine ligase
MLTCAGPRVIEFNVRLGDPEAQVVIPLLDGDLTPALIAAADGALDRLRHPLPRFRQGAAVGVVLASAGYPGSVSTGRPISGLDAAGSLSDALVFHAGTAVRDGAVITAGGRVLTVVGRGGTYDEARAVAYRGVAGISFDGMQHRRDIGQKALSRAR